MARVWTTARYSLNGHSTFPGGAVTDIQTADDITDVCIVNDDVFPQPSVDGETEFGFVAATTSGENGNYTEAGGAGQPYAATLSGQAAGSIFRSLLRAGEYDLWHAVGSTVAGGAQNSIIVEGTFLAFYYGVPGLSDGITTTPGSWAATTAKSVGNQVIADDLGILTCTVAGTTGATSPTTTGMAYEDTVVDGSVTWKFTGRRALLRAHGTTGSTSQIVTHNSNGSPVNASSTTDWPGTGKRVTITDQFGALGYTAIRNNAQYAFRAMAHEIVPFALTDVVVRDEFGADTSLAPTLYAMQPNGHYDLKIEAQTGLAGASAFSLSGDLAPYFDVATYQDGVWLRRNATPMPDALAGSRSLGIVQTDAEGTGSPYTTTLTCTVVSSQGRSLSAASYPDMPYLASVCTQSWLDYKRVKDVHDVDLWTGWDGVTAFATTATVDGETAFRAALAAAASAATGSSWHLIELQEAMSDPYSGAAAFGAPFGTGGLVIRRAAGHDPIFASSFTSLAGQIDFRDLLISCSQALNPNTRMPVPDVGSDGIGTSGEFVCLNFDNCRIGAGISVADDATVYSDVVRFLYLNHGKSLRIVNSVIDAVSASAISVAGVRAVRISKNRFTRLGTDVFAYSGPAVLSSTVGVFADDSPYIMFDQNMWHKEPDWVGRPGSGAHADGMQRRTPNNNTSFWYANSGRENEVSTPWIVGNTCYVRETERWYTVASVTTGITGSTPPSGIGTGIVDGGVTWDFVSENIFDVPAYVAMLDNDGISATPLSGAQNARQDHIDSGAGYGAPVHLLAVNNVLSNNGEKGLQVNHGFVNAEFNTLAGPWDTYSGDGYSPKIIKGVPTTGAGTANNPVTIRALHNVVSGPTQCDGGLLAVFDEVVVKWRTDQSTVGVDRPQDLLIGPFDTSTYASGTLHTFTSLNDTDPTVDRETLRAVFRGILAAQSGTAGFIPDEAGPEPEPPSGTVGWSSLSLSYRLGL